MALTCGCRVKIPALTLVALILSTPAESSGRTVSVSLDPDIVESEITGRLFLIVNDEPEPTPREVASMIFAAVAENPIWGSYAPLFGQDVEQWKPGSAVRMTNGQIQGYPFNSLDEFPPGDYYVQAVLNIYTKFQRADGHTIWAAMDHWDGQQFHISPDNLYSEVKKVTIGDGKSDIELNLTEKIPPIELPEDTRFTKRLKFKSALASE
jgi:hypothetical protein